MVCEEDVLPAFVAPNVIRAAGAQKRSISHDGEVGPSRKRTAVNDRTQARVARFVAQKPSCIRCDKFHGTIDKRGCCSRCWDEGQRENTFPFRPSDISVQSSVPLPVAPTVVPAVAVLVQQPDNSLQLSSPQSGQSVDLGDLSVSRFLA